MDNEIRTRLIQVEVNEKLKMKLYNIFSPRLFHKYSQNAITHHISFLKKRLGSFKVDDQMPSED